MQYLFDGDAKVYEAADEKIKLSMTFVELNDMVEREKLVMKEDMVFETMEADKWQDVFGFGR
jgi:hypothetical protein